MSDSSSPTSCRGITICQLGFRAHYWSSDGKYSTKTFLTMGEAQGWLATMKAKYP